MYEALDKYDPCMRAYTIKKIWGTNVLYILLHMENTQIYS